MSKIKTHLRKPITLGKKSLIEHSGLSFPNIIIPATPYSMDLRLIDSDETDLTKKYAIMFYNRKTKKAMVAGERIGDNKNITPYPELKEMHFPNAKLYVI